MNSVALPTTEKETDIVAELRGLLDNADAWLDTPNDRFGGRPPRELLGTEREQQLRDLVQGVKLGMHT